MSIELEEQLRRAYGQLPDGDGNRVDVLARSRHAAVKLRRRRTVGMCAGTMAAALTVGAVAAFGPGLATSGRHTSLVPAGGATATTTHSASAPPPVIPPAPTTTKQPPLAKEDTDKPLAGLSGRLLPHGGQLAAGLAYHGTTNTDYRKTWATSRADGYPYGMPVPVLIGADQRMDAPTPAQVNAAYGVVSSVEDMANTSGPDTSSQFRSVDSAIARFRTPALAQSAIAKTQRTEGGLYWTKPQLTTPNVAWSGVPGATGDHGVYDYPAGTPQKLFVAYQVVGSYIVSAHSAKAATAEKAVTDMVGNLKTVGLLK